MRVLVIGGTGKVGRLLAARLRALGHAAVPLARNPGPDGITADLADPAAIEAAARSFDRAFLTTPLRPDEAEVGLAAHAALLRAGVGKIVYLAAHNLNAMARIPHFATKIPIRDEVLAHPGGVVLAPNFFFQNDLLALEAITGHGVYPLPIGDGGVWSIDVADIAEAATRALLDDSWNGQVVPLCGPERLTGSAVAASWAEATGRPVSYGGDAIAPFITAMRSRLPDFSDWMAADFTAMMEVTQETGCPASVADRAATEAILGRKPISHQQFAAHAFGKDAS